ncbi:MAG: AHH domain-containing protein [Clostridia bacterium]|nr:AHH domain-containing protein [Clostridia bacterium]
MITYKNIKLKSPYEIQNLLELKIVKDINQHAKVFLRGIIPEEKKDTYVERASIQDKIEVSQTDDNNETLDLFTGIITGVEIKTVRGIYYIEAEGLSYTYNLDIKLKSRSFQDENMHYKELVKTVIADLKGADFIDLAAGSKKIDKFIVQYNETDWEFLKRMASHFNTGLVADAASENPKFWFGIPGGNEKGNLENYHYNVVKKIGDFRSSSENFIEGIDERDFIYYKIETEQYFNIGDTVNYKDKKLFVAKVTTEIKNSVLKHEYILTPRNGLSQNLEFNKKVFRRAIEGKVIDIKEDHVRIHLEIDQDQKKEEAYWFPYSTFYTTEGNTGWYCMPELNDFVKLYFPTTKEEQGVVLQSIRKGTKAGDKIKDPNIKYFRTKFGKEKMYNEKEIVVSAKDEKVLIRFNEDKGVEVFSDKEIKIKSDEDLVLNAKKIEMKAREEIVWVCNNSSIKMEGETHIRGKFVKEMGSFSWSVEWKEPRFEPNEIDRSGITMLGKSTERGGMDHGDQAGSERLLPGTPGVVTGGDSTRLGKNMMESMGLKRSAKWSGYQAQHIIPSEMADHAVIKKIGMDMDDASNGLFLRVPDESISPMSRHKGFHSVYNEVVQRALDKMNINQSVNALQKQVYKLQQNLKYLQQKGLPLYPSQGATVELWERQLSKL